jgi:hypothetical protein
VQYEIAAVYLAMPVLTHVHSKMKLFWDYAIISRMKTDGLTERKVSLTNLDRRNAGSDAATQLYNSPISQP